MISDELTPTQKEIVLERLGIKLQGEPNPKGYFKMSSPLRDDGKNQSFFINPSKGAWKDFGGGGDSGDLVTLVERLKGMTNAEATKWVAEQVDLSLSAQPKNGRNKPAKESPQNFWTAQRKKLWKKAIRRLENEPDNPVVKIAKQRECLNSETLKAFHCGILNGKDIGWSDSDWLVMPFSTGAKMYCVDTEKNKSITPHWKEKPKQKAPGSKPSLSFFRRSETDKLSDLLFIAKSPRETMLLTQEFGNQADVIGLATGEKGKLSTTQSYGLTEQISAANYSHIYTFLDCDTETAYQTANEFTNEVARIAQKQNFSGDVSIVNIHKYSGGKYKDITDAIRDGMPSDQLQSILDHSEVFIVHFPCLYEREHLNEDTQVVDSQHVTGVHGDNAREQPWFLPSDPLKEPVPELEFVVDGYCAKGLISVIGGSAGSGKSLLNQILFQKRNDELLPTRLGKAIYLTGADSSSSEIRRRAKAIKVNNGLETVCIPEDLYCVATNEQFMKDLTRNIIDYGADTVIFDTLADFHDGNLYEAELANKTMKEFTTLARSANVAVILITHTRKGSKIKQSYNVEDISDSRVFGTKADFVFGLKSEYQQDGSNLIELQCVKSRSAQPPQPMRAEIFLNTITNELKIRRCDKLFTAELESQSKEQEREHKIKQVHQLKEEGKSVREIAEELEIAVGTVSKYSKEDTNDTVPF